jgi:ABC-2 type transport system permease protein
MFNVVSVRRYCPNPLDTIKKYHLKAMVLLPADLDRSLESQTSPADINIYVDGADPNTGTLLRNMIKPFIQNSIMQYLGFDPPRVIRIRPSILYNPYQESSLFFVPGLMALILIMLSTLMTSLTLTREKERGTMQQLLISPLSPSEIMIGKLLPYIFLALLDAFVILLAGHLFFRVRVQGSYLFLALCTVVYVITSLSLGLIFSTVAKNQIQAIFMALPATMLPSMILSGFIFPLASMPWILQAVGRVIPATWYLDCIRGIILKGAGPALLWKPLLALCGIGLFFIVIAIKRFKVRL